MCQLSFLSISLQVINTRFEIWHPHGISLIGGFSKHQTYGVSWCHLSWEMCYTLWALFSLLCMWYEITSSMQIAVYHSHIASSMRPLDWEVQISGNDSWLYYREYLLRAHLKSNCNPLKIHYCPTLRIVYKLATCSTLY